MLIAVAESQLGILDGIISARITEAKLEGRATLEDSKAKILEGYKNRSKGAYVDDLENPKHCLIVGYYKANITTENTMVVHLIYSLPEHRGDLRALAEIKSTMMALAEINGVDTISASSWIFKGCDPIDELWERFGFEPQEKVFIKFVKE